MNNLINLLALGKVLKRHIQTAQNNYQIIFFSMRKTTIWSAIDRLIRN